MNPGQPIESPESPFILPARYLVKWHKVLALVALLMGLLVLFWGASVYAFLYFAGYLGGSSSHEVQHEFLSTPQEKFVGLGMALITLIGLVKLMRPRKEPQKEFHADLRRQTWPYQAPKEWRRRL